MNFFITRVSRSLFNFISTIISGGSFFKIRALVCTYGGSFERISLYATSSCEAFFNVVWWLNFLDIVITVQCCSLLPPLILLSSHLRESLGMSSSNRKVLVPILIFLTVSLESRQIYILSSSSSIPVAVAEPPQYVKIQSLDRNIVRRNFEGMARVEDDKSQFEDMMPAKKKRGPSCLFRCLRFGKLHPAQCHMMCWSSCVQSIFIFIVYLLNYIIIYKKKKYKLQWHIWNKWVHNC